MDEILHPIFGSDGHSWGLVGKRDLKADAYRAVKQEKCPKIRKRG